MQFSLKKTFYRNRLRGVCVIDIVEKSFALCCVQFVNNAEGQSGAGTKYMSVSFGQLDVFWWGSKRMLKPMHL